MSKSIIQSVEARLLDHAGLVSAIVDHLGIVQKVDKILPKISQKHHVSHGQVVKALIIVGLGFQKRRLYLVKDFFKCRPVDLLFGKGVKAEHFDHNACGRTLDAIYKFGVENFYYELISRIDNERDILNSIYRGDTTSLSVQGKFIKGKKGDGALALGHSKQHRPDLLQLVLSMGMSGVANLPVFMGIHSGNENDKEILPRITKNIQLLKNNIKWSKKVIKVADAAIYSERFVRDNLFDSIWVTRIPEGREARKLLEMKIDDDEWETYGKLKYQTHIVKKYGVEQRWILLYSEKSFYKQIGTLRRNIDKYSKKLFKKVKKINTRIFENKHDAKYAVQGLKKKYKLFSIYHRFYRSYKIVKRGKRSRKVFKGYTVFLDYQINKAAYEKEKRKRGRFIIGSNECDESKLSDIKMIRTYLGQDDMEKGFQLIKDDTFSLSDIYLKKKGRIHSLMLIMVISLFVYNYGTWWLRKNLKKNKKYYSNSKGDLTQKPTLKWVFESMRNIIQVKIKIRNKVHQYICNFNDLHKVVVNQFGYFADAIYGFP